MSAADSWRPKSGPKENAPHEGGAHEAEQIENNTMNSTASDSGERAPGASPADWDHFDLVLGLGADLLPVVSNTAATISPDSKMRDLGKTPSRYNKDRQVVGIAGWTSHQASDQDISRWSKEREYGICLQTRAVRALDIDVADPEKAQAIAAFIQSRMFDLLPVRHRENSGKCQRCWPTG